jgi:putative membrane protein
VLSAIVSSLHVLAVATALGAVFARGRALKRPLDAAGFRTLFAADNAWGLAALVLLLTGVLRAFAGLDKGTAFYVASPLFWVKIGLFVLVVALEVRPMLTFLRWRRQLGHGGAPDTSGARALYHLNHAELALAVLIVFVASFMARGFGAR